VKKTIILIVMNLFGSKAEAKSASYSSLSSRLHREEKGYSLGKRLLPLELMLRKLVEDEKAVERDANDDKVETGNVEVGEVDGVLVGAELVEGFADDGDDGEEGTEDRVLMSEQEENGGIGQLGLEFRRDSSGRDHEKRRRRRT
jgi:hypothetical protein